MLETAKMAEQNDWMANCLHERTTIFLP
jgi:hypothetical protein